MSFKSAKIPGGHVRWTVLWANAVSSGGVSPSRDTFDNTGEDDMRAAVLTGHGSPASMTSAFRPSGHFALASAHSGRAWRSTGWYSMRSSPCARGKERRSGVSSELWFQKFYPVGFARPGRITSRPRARYQGRSLSARGLLCSHREDCRAHGLARLQVAMRLCGVFQRVGLLDLDLDR